MRINVSAELNLREVAKIAIISAYEEMEGRLYGRLVEEYSMAKVISEEEYGELLRTDPREVFENVHG